jgi:hypothetical protein
MHLTAWHEIMHEERVREKVRERRRGSLGRPSFKTLALIAIGAAGAGVALAARDSSALHRLIEAVIPAPRPPDDAEQRGEQDDPNVIYTE